MDIKFGITPVSPELLDFPTPPSNIWVDENGDPWVDENGDFWTDE